MNRLLNRKPFVLLAVAAVLVGATVFTISHFGSNNVKAQAGFSNASLHGTYAFYAVGVTNSNPPIFDRTRFGVYYLDGNGGPWPFRAGDIRPGEPDDMGSPTTEYIEPRLIELPGTSYVVQPDGFFQLLLPDGSIALTGLITRAEEIDGVLVATEYVVFSRNLNPAGHLPVWHGTRVSDANLMPPPLN